MEEMSYKRLRELQRSEKEGAALVALPRDFYSSLCGFLKEKKASAANDGELQRREYENAIKIIREINALRKQKILFRAVRSGSRHETEGMTAEEHSLYDKFCGLLGEDAQWFEGLMCGEAAAWAKPAAAPTGNGGKIKKVQVLKEVLAYTGADNQTTYGPYKPGDEASLPSEEADFLVKSKFAQML